MLFFNAQKNQSTFLALKGASIEVWELKLANFLFDQVWFCVAAKTRRISLRRILLFLLSFSDRNWNSVQGRSTIPPRNFFLRSSRSFLENGLRLRLSKRNTHYWRHFPIIVSSHVNYIYTSSFVTFSYQSTSLDKTTISYVTFFAIWEVFCNAAAWSAYPIFLFLWRD